MNGKLYSDNGEARMHIQTTYADRQIIEPI